MINLIPSWATHYEAFWETIRRRNLWFIKLRYGAVLMLTVFIVLTEWLFEFDYSGIQLSALIIITSSILIYNIILNWVRKFLKCGPEGFNPLHFSLVQMLLDLIALSFLIYFTGGIETPLYMLFIFHMVIGSLILPGFIIYSIAGFVIILFSTIVIGNYMQLIPLYHIQGLQDYYLTNNLKYLVFVISTFSFVMLISVLLVNRISQQLYKLEEKLYDSLERLKKAEKEKQKYVMAVMHEIKSPLAAMQAYIEIILDKYVGPISKMVEDKLLRAKIRGRDAIELTNNILKISRLRLLDEIAAEKVDLQQLLLSIYKKQKVHIKEKNIKLDIVDQRISKDDINGDKFLLEIALSNLIGNALKYTGCDGKILITLCTDDKNTCLKICDNGIGIPQNDIQNIFNDFYRASNIKEKMIEGTGLGLSIVKQIIERHGGKISVESPSELESENKPGTCFTITIPLNKEG